MDSKKVSRILALFVVGIVFIGFGLFTYNYYKSPITFIGIDINPSIELSTNRLNEVVDIIPLNEDADLLLADLDLIGMDAEEATAKIIDTATELGFIDELSEDNAIAISVSSTAEEDELEIEEDLSDEINNHLEERNIPAFVLTGGGNEEIKALADEYGVNNGKMIMIQRAVTLNPDLTIESLVDKPMRAIASELKEVRKDVIEANKQERKQVLIQQKENLRKTVQTRVENAVQQMLQQNSDRFPNLDDTETIEAAKETLIEETKARLRDSIDNVISDVKEEWSEKKDEVNNNVPKKIKDKIKSIKDRFKGINR